MKRYFIYKEGPDRRHIPTRNNRYLVVNVDEPYAEDVFNLIKAEEQRKGTWDGPEKFEDFVGELRRGSDAG